MEKFGGPGGIRTPDFLLRRQTLYPAELQARNENFDEEFEGGIPFCWGPLTDSRALIGAVALIRATIRPRTQPKAGLAHCRPATGRPIRHWRRSRGFESHTLRSM